MAQTLKKILEPSDEVEVKKNAVEPFFTMTLDSPPSCLEFIPYSAAYPHHLVAGTYSLDPGSSTSLNESGAIQSRSGSLVLLRLKDERLKVLHTEVTPYAVLDLHFSPQDDELFAVATSIGSVDLYSLKKSSTGFEKTRSFQVSDPSTLVLSLAWSPELSSGDSAIGISLSDGQIGFISFTAVEQIIKLSKPHTMEAWTVAWSEIQIYGEALLCLYSGGDDSVICKSGYASTCEGCEDEEGVLELSLERTARDMKTHGAGVTAILPIDRLEDDKEQIIITGSYDECIRVLTLPNGIGKANVLAEERIHGGGVWKLKLIDTSLQDVEQPEIRLLASCMHAGPRVIEISRTKGGRWKINVVAKCVSHESMNYASDARKCGPEGKSSLAVVSTSFYDRKVCVWGVKGSEEE